MTSAHKSNPGLRGKDAAASMLVVALLLGPGLTQCADYTATNAALGLLLLPAAVGPTEGGVEAGPEEPAGPDWRDPAWTSRRRIVFGTAHSTLPTGYTITLSADTQTASGNAALASGDDVRIIWHAQDGTSSELDRIGTNWNAANTQIDFRLQSEVPANSNEASDGSYYLYFNNASAGTPPTAEENVYYFADFFNRANGAPGKGWSVWSDGGSTQITSGALVIAPTGDSAPPNTGAQRSFGPGAIPGDFQVSFDWTMPASSEGMWVFYGIQIGDASTMDKSSRTNGVGPALFQCEDEGCPPAGTSTYNISNNISLTPIESGVTGAHSFALRVDASAFTYEYDRDNGTTTASGVAFANNVSNLDAIRVGADNFGVDYTSDFPHTIDNLQLRLLVADDPEPALEAIETL